MTGRSPYTIAAEALQTLLGEPGVSIVDASWYLPAQNRDGRAEYLAARIPGAAFLDIDEASEPGGALPHMLPSAADFAAIAGQLGIFETDRIIVYDGPGLFSAARAWWMFRVMGARDVRVLDGGFDRWREEGRPVETGAPALRRNAVFQATLDSSAVRTIDDIRINLKSGKAQILDARPYARFTGETAEPRPGLRSGHIPGSRSLPFDRLVERGALKDLQALREIFSEYALTPLRPAITTCGSGVTAAVISLALASIGHENSGLYDGSWAEWGQADDAPVARWPGRQDHGKPE
jgi:thiosulfate/3-mercaptopyruvate sulfurtransferase